MSHMSEKIIIFDFDGVIANGLFSAVKIYNEIGQSNMVLERLILRYQRIVKSRNA